MDNLSGAVERITFYNPENGYTVLRLRPEVSRGQRIPGLSLDGLTTVIGNTSTRPYGQSVQRLLSDGVNTSACKGCGTRTRAWRPIQSQKKR